MKTLSIAIAGICILSIAGSAFGEGHHSKNSNHQSRHYEQVNTCSENSFREYGYPQGQSREQWCNMYDYSKWEHQRPYKRNNYYHNYYNPYFKHHNWTPRAYYARPVIYVYNSYGMPIR